ncbi:DNA polymerase Y family protein [Candidatus Poriferisodalis sp.]|uniref:DNA polymerase Y family protein n=1 Tax=Candidatus Poriferisodalis sp. TaxID=3101277 RepID=UPI003B0187AE
MRDNRDSRASLTGQGEPADVPPRMLAAEVGNWSAVAAGFDPAAPAAVVSAGRITAVTPAAAAAGIRTGMRRRQAQTECPVLELAEHDPDLDARCFAPVAAALEDLAPRVEVLAPGCCVIATRGPSRYYGGDEALAELVHRTVAGVLAGEPGTAGARGVGASDTAGARGVGASNPAVSVGIADGLFAAGLAGRAASVRTPSMPVLVVAAGCSASFLGTLPISTLAEPFSPLAGASSTARDFIDVLRRLGLRSLADVAALPVADLVGRFGTQGEWAHRLASGRDPRLSQPGVAQPELSVETEIDPPADRLDSVAFAAKSLADQLDARLARLGQALVCVEISAETEHGETTSRRWRHGFRFSPPDVVDRVRWQLDGWRAGKRTRASGRVSHIRLTVAETVPDEGRQLGFWGGQSEADERAERALQRVQTLVGFDSVTVGRLGSGRRFADLEQRLPFGTAGASNTAGPLGTGASNTVGPRGTGASNTAPWPGRLGAPAPAEVMVEPEPLMVLDADGEPVGVSGRAQLSAPPAVLRRVDGRTSRITAWAGPWPLDERWWDRAARRRQARFQLVLDDGTAHLCAVEGGRWQREATYD